MNKRTRKKQSEGIRAKILELINAKGPLRIDDLVGLTGFDRPAIDKAIKFMREKEMIFRHRPDLSDMRKCFYDVIRGRR